MLPIIALLLSILAASAQSEFFAYDSSANLVLQTNENLAKPQIIGQPRQQVVQPGQLASFSVVLADTSGVTFQWFFNGTTPLSGATADTLLITNVSGSNQGVYDVVMVNGSGTVTSSVAPLLIDSRGCGMPDSWQLAYFGNLTQNSSADADGDGISNLQEFLDGTNPANAASALYHITLFSDGGTVTVVPDQPAYTNGQVVTLTANSFAATPFHAWTGDAVSTSNSISLTVTTNMILFAHFTPVDFQWTNSVGGDWYSAANWSPNLVPGTNDNIIITNSGTVTLSAPAACDNFTFGSPGASPTLTGSGALTIQGAGNWASGTMTGGGDTIIPPGGTLNIPGSDTIYLSSRTLENGGTILWSGAANIYTVDTVITNRAGALFDAQNAASIYLVSGVPSRFDNAGTFQKSGAGTTSLSGSVAFNNYNTLNIQNGTLDLGWGGTNTGTITVPNNAVLTVSGGTFLSSADSSITGEGQLMLIGGAATFAGLVNLTGTNTFSGGSAEFTGNYFCTNNTLVISGGTAEFDGTGAVAPAVLNMIVGGALGGAQTVTVGSVMNWLEGTMTGGGRTVIPPGVTLNIPGADTVYLYNRTVDNGGTILWSGGANIYTVGTVITNRAGALFDAQNAASFYLVSGAPSRIDNAGTFRKSGAGTTSVGNSIAFNNYKTVTIQTGILSAAGGYTSSSNALLNCVIGGTAAGTGFGQLQVAGTVALTGTLGVTISNGFIPATGDSFPVVTADARNGVFTGFNYPSNVVNLQISNSPNSVLLVVGGLVNPPLVLLPPQIAGSNINFTWTAISNLTYRLEFNSNLNPTNWSAVPGDVIATTNVATKSDMLTGTNRFYRVHLLP